MKITKDTKNTLKKIVEIAAAIIVCQCAGIIGSFFTVNSVKTWYVTLNKPSFNPPSWVFGPAWGILYTMMGVALYIIWQKRKTFAVSNIPLTVFFVQLLLNTAWSIIFFGARQIFPAFIEIVILWIMIVVTIFYFVKNDKRAGLLLVPYLCWVSFASVLNYYLWILNR
jgi:translocator protein